LLDAKATAYEIRAYLTLAKFTEGTGVYSTASVKAGYGNQSPVESSMLSGSQAPTASPQASHGITVL
jgi:hypothetical protein